MVNETDKSPYSRGAYPLVLDKKAIKMFFFWNVLKNNEVQLSTFIKIFTMNICPSVLLMSCINFLEIITIPFHICYVWPNFPPQRLNQFTLTPTVNEKADSPHLSSAGISLLFLIIANVQDKIWHLMDVLICIVLVIDEVSSHKI